MADGLGQNAFLGIGKQTVFETLITRSKFLKIVSESVKEEEGKDYAKNLTDISVDTDSVIQTTRKVGGGFKIYNRWEGAELLFLQAIGSVATTYPDATNAPTARQHVFSIIDLLPVGLSLEIGRDIKSLLVAGCKIKSMKITQPLRGPLEIDFTIVGSLATYDTPSTPTYTLKRVIKNTDVATFITYNVSQLKVAAFEITITNKMSEDDTYISQRTIDEMVRDGEVEVMGSLTCRWDAITRRTDFAAATPRALQAKWEGDVIAEAAPTIKQKFQIDCPAIIIEGFDNSVPAMGRIMEKLNFRALKVDSSNREVKLTLINSVTTV